MTTTELYTKGARVWLPDPDTVWKAAELISDYVDDKLEIEFEDGDQETLEIPSPEKLPFLRNPAILIGQNDLTSLSYLHEPAVLYNLQVRFHDSREIYTYCGIVLVAINPYEYLPIYDTDTIMAYSGRDQGELDPHIFAVAEEAFKRMSREDRDQSIIVSGESGAGKTVSAKYAMRYFATVGGSHTETQIERKVLASNPIMEAIGNAKTIRNDNSSRFGKYIEIDFNKKFHIVGANMRTYLLEKSRVVFQASEERNYHIFYQLCSCADEPEFEHLKLRQEGVQSHQDNFVYTNQGESPTVDTIDDVAQFRELRDSFRLLGIVDDVQMEIFEILAAILHMGNVKIAEAENDMSLVRKDDKSISIVADLLQVELELLRGWLCNRKIVTRGETFIKGLKKSEAQFAKDALAKHIYARLFDWIVTQVNKELKCVEKRLRFTGVLDIYGFETFDVNSFEQFCINYANEKLQQQFNMHVFKLEQEEYVREKIQWSFIDFYDNQPCINLIEGKLGLLDLLDEECMMPKGTDKSWCQKLYDKHNGKSKHFMKPRLSNTSFIVDHFADKVEYEVDGFLDKNRDTVIEEHLAVLRTSKSELVRTLFAEVKETPVKSSKSQSKTGTGSSQKSNKKTVGNQFKGSLTSLMSALMATTPHFVRCIKPNDDKAAFTFDPQRAIQQLRACGVLETIRISAAGYPSRWTYKEFFTRYRVLIKSCQINRKDMRETSKNLLKNLIQDEDKFQFGKTKIFFRAGQVAYMEKLRSDRLKACGIMIQKHIKGFLLRTQYQKMRKGAITIQRFVRGFLAQRLLLFLRRTRAAIAIQRYWRGFYEWQKYTKLQKLAVSLQCRIRGLYARRRYQVLLRNCKATVIQRNVRMWLVRKQYRKVIRGFIRLQCHVRRRNAKKIFKALKIEARSIEGVKKQNLGLENRIISQQQKIDEINKENAKLRADVASLAALQQELESLRGNKEEMIQMSNKIAELEEEIRRLIEELAREKEEKKDLVSEKELLIKNHGEEVRVLKEENERLQKEMEQLQEHGTNFEDKARQKADQSKAEFEAELDNERSQYQALLQKYAQLELKYEQMKEKRAVPVRGHARAGSDTSTVSIETDISETSTVRIDDLSKEDLGYGSVTRRKVEKKPSFREEDDNLRDLITKLEAQLNDSIFEKQKLQEKIDFLSAELRKKVSVPDIKVTPTSPVSENGIDDIVIKEMKEEPLRTENLAQDSNLANSIERFDAEEEEEEKLFFMSPRDSLKINDLEIENAKLRADIKALREAAVEDIDEDKYRVMLDQFNAMSIELERRREEVIQLKTILASRQLGISALLKEQYSGGDADLINEDGELEMAYRTMKDANRLLENQLQKEKKNCQELKDENKRLLKDNDRQQKIISARLVLNQGEKTVNQIQHEVQRLTEDNIDLNETIEMLQDQNHKLKKQLKIYAKKLKATGGSELTLEELQEVQGGRSSPVGNMPIVKHKEVEYMGMLEYRKEDESTLIKNVICDLRPKVAAQFLPGLPAYMIFMCIRYTDYINDDDKVRSLLTNTINSIKRLFKKKRDDIECTTLWLANTCRLLHNLKQYSGETAFQHSNTPKQNDQCLRNFDLSEYRQILSDMAVNIYQGTIRFIEEKVHAAIIPGVLEHEEIKGFSVTQPGLNRQSSIDLGSQSQVDAMEILIKQITFFYQTFATHAVDPELVNQIFRQLYYFVCSVALNDLLLRKDLCHWSKGMQIRYNISHLEQFCRDNNLQDSGAVEALEPIIQAAQLLQARKEADDVASICDMCSKLSVPQIVKILHLYTPVNEFEKRVPTSFIRKVQEHLRSRNDSTQNLLMDTKFTYPVRFPFNPSQIQLEQICIPDSLGLKFLKRI